MKIFSEMNPHLSGVSYTQILVIIWLCPFEILIHLAWETQIDFKWIRSLISTHFSEIR